MISPTFSLTNKYAASIATATLLILAAEAFALGGTVVDEDGVAVAGATVTLMSDTAVRQTTGANGAFSLNTSSAIAPGVSGSASSAAERIAVRGGRLGFTLPEPARAVSVRVFAGDGSLLFATAPRAMAAGDHHVDLSRLAPGAHLLRIDRDGFSTTLPFVLPQGSGKTGGAFVSSSLTPPPLARRAATAAAIDTVRIEKTGSLTTWIPIESYADADLEIVLPEGAPLPPVSDYTIDGPFETVVETNVGPGNAYTIIRPATLGGNGFRHAPIIYGHGINGQVSGFTNFLKNVASHGFVIIACNVLTGGPNAAANTDAMNTGLAWILAQDTVTGSIYQGKLATKRAASMGYSVGGTAAVDIGAHPALKTVVSIHGHISTATLHGTLLQTTGTNDNVGLPMQEETYGNSMVPTFLGTVTDAGHGYIQENNGGVQRPAIVAWLRLRLYNDRGAARYFYGDDCVLCTAPWENPQRKNWE